MCGLIGMFGDLRYDDEAAIKRMQLLNWFRGPHSTGFAAIRNNGDVKIAKQLGGPWELWEYPRFKEALNANNSCVFMGHARFATRGNISTVNAHPFHCGHIVGMHNGTLDFTCTKELKDLLGEEYPVDSMAIFKAIEELGVEEVIPLLQGSYALAWTDLEKGTFNLIRNGDRPLWMATAKDGKWVGFASEWPMIGCGLALDGRDGKSEYREMKRDKEGSRFYGLAKDFLHTWDLNEVKKGKAKPVCKKLEGKEPFLAVSSNYGVHRGGNKSDPFRRTESQAPVVPFNPNTPTNGRTTTSRTGSGLEDLSMTVEGTEAVPYPGISRQEFEDWTQDGCQFCQKPIPWGTRGITIYERQQMVLCQEHSARIPDGGVRIYAKEITTSRSLRDIRPPVAA